MTSYGNEIKAAFNVLTPDGQTERLTFRRFKGEALANAAETGGVVRDSDVTSVALMVNPEQIQFNEPKIISKIQTNQPNSFVIFDWGTDLLSITINGNTGNLLPGIVQSGFNPISDMVEQAALKIDPSLGTINKNSIALPGEVLPYAQNVLLGTLTYHELLDMSPKFRVFDRLYRIYKSFDADADVLTFEMGARVFRGYFMDFNYIQLAAEPWNWKYSIVFISQQELSESIRRDDEEHTRDSRVVDMDE